MTRLLTVGAAQLGPIERADTRKDVVERMLALLTEAAERSCDLVVFPELALTTFFPRWFVADITEFDHFYEAAMPGPETQPLFDEARRLGIGFCLGYAELTEPDADGVRHRYNTQILVERDGSVVARYRKVHLPGHEDARAGPAVPARRALLLRARAGGLRRVAGVRRPRRHDDLQRPALVGVVPGDGAAGRRADPVRLQLADPLPAGPQPGHPPGLPQRPRHAGRRLPERHVGGRRRQGRHRGRASTRWPRA